MLASFITCLLLFVAIGVSAARKSRGTSRDYYLAEQSVPPSLVGLSAVATNNSGYMFIGAIGYTYAVGLASVWLMVGWIAGDFLASLFVHHKLREAAAETTQSSYAGILSHWEGRQHFNTLRRTAALITLLFLLAYASAQLVAGSKALSVLLDWPIWAGAVLGAIIVVAYCFSGGIRASIWTDAAQSVVMVFAMALMLVVALKASGGFSGAIAQMSDIDHFLDWYPRDLPFPGLGGGILFAASWLFAGLSVIGQPHIMIRFAALNDAREMRRARLYYYLWFTVFYVMAIGVGLLARILLDNPAQFDAELALPSIALELLPPPLVGLVLAGIFAATISTADSLILSCSAALSNDLLGHKLHEGWKIRLSTLGMTTVALCLSITDKQSVFALVILAWAALASAFAPLLIVLCLGGRPGEKLALSMMIAGVLSSASWRWAGLADAVYEGMPGILVGLGVYLLGKHRATAANATSAPTDS
ncbi:MAG: sodium/proline symporter [Pseudomonadales bacterium]|nr:sodium/proline symporter [Pseudomonadales bacterium]